MLIRGLLDLLWQYNRYCVCITNIAKEFGLLREGDGGGEERERGMQNDIQYNIIVICVAGQGRGLVRLAQCLEACNHYPP